MANTILSSLTGLTSVAPGDLIYLCDVSDNTDNAAGSSRKITYANLTGGATATELGYVSGVTSALQTQMDLKAPLASPTLVTPVLGVATATTINKVTITAPATASTLTIAQGSSLITAGAYAITLTATGATGVTLPTTGTLSAIAGTETLANKTLSSPHIDTPDLDGDADLIDADGNITVAGADPWRTVSIFGGMKPTTTSGCADKTTIEAATNDIDYDVLDFDTGSDENAFVNFQMPDSWDAGVIQFRYVWTNAAGLTTETVTFELSGRSFADNDAIDQAVGTAIEVADTWIAQGDVHISAWSGDVTLAGTAAAGEWVHFEIMRDISEDDLTGDARLMDVQIKYRQAQYTD